MSTQTEALRLADYLDIDGKHKCAAELRRLCEVNAELLKALQDISRQPEGDEQSAQAIAKEVLKIHAKNTTNGGT